MADLKSDLAECVRLHWKWCETGSRDDKAEFVNEADQFFIDHGDELLAVVEDAVRYRLLRDSRHSALHLTRNSDHTVNYMTAADWIDEHPDEFADNTEGERHAMKDADTIWSLQIYPYTPIGSWVWHAATADAVIDAAMRVVAGNGGGDG